MTPHEFRIALAVLDLKQVGAAKALGLSTDQISRYATGRSEIPEPVAIALRLMAENRELRARLAERHAA